MTKRITPNQVKALLYLILRSSDADSECKKILFAMIKNSGNLTKPVYFTTHSKKVADSIDRLLCYDHKTYLNEIFMVMGSDFRLYHHNGSFSELGQFQADYSLKKKIAYTIFLSVEPYDDDALEIRPDKVTNIRLTDPFYHNAKH